MKTERRLKIVDALKDKGVKLPCPRCGSLNFEVVDQTAVGINDNLNTSIVDGPFLPAAIIACSQCGFITLHALSALNLMPKDESSS